MAFAGDQRMQKETVSILVIDDEPDMMEMLVFGLSERGLKVCMATSGAEAVELARREHFDIALTDFMMPRMNGLATTAALKKVSPDMDVILTSAYLPEADLDQCLQAGATEYIAKPFTLAELDDVLGRIIEHRRTRGQNRTTRRDRSM
jgi:CheY-like chemotaxis protein